MFNVVMYINQPGLCRTVCRNVNKSNIVVSRSLAYLAYNSHVKPYEQTNAIGIAFPVVKESCI